MDTFFTLMAEYKSLDIPLEQVAAKYLGMTKERAFRLAASQSLPFPAYKMSYSQKSVWMVRLTDLAVYLDNERDRAVAEWQAVNKKHWLTTPLVKPSSQ